MSNQEILKYIGDDTLSVVEAMRRIDKNSCGILFVVDAEERLMGCLTDGDVRRYLLAGGGLDDSVMNAVNRNLKYSYTSEEAQHLYHKKNFVAIPIIDEDRKILDIYFGDESIERSKLNIPVVINAGGKGTRLDPFTRVLPKPLIPVGELPIIELIMKEYQSYACNDFHIIVNYKKELMKAYFADNDREYDISWYDEKQPLGTGGGLSLLKGKINTTFFFANCDALLTANYGSILQFHRENQNVITMICAYKNISIPYGVVEMGVNGKIEGMKEKPEISILTNTGIYLVEPSVLDDVEDGVSIGFPDIIEKQRQKGNRVAVFPVSENDWMDMGQIPELEKMRAKLYGE